MPLKISYLLASLTVLLAPLITSTSAEGLDCKGAFHCHDFAPTEDLPLLEVAVNETSDAQTFPNGANIACLPGITEKSTDGGICVWMWNTDNTTTGAEVKVLYQRYKAHKCRVCGNVPIDGSANDDSKGQMTVGWSPGTPCDGVCNASGGSDYLPGNVVPGAGLVGGST